MGDRQEAPDELPGLDLPALQRWLNAEHPGTAVGPLSATLVAGGRSNLTFLVDDDAHHWVLRRPPLGHVLATAHDMAREHRVVSALADTPVPVPGTVVLHADVETSPLGAPFYLMQRVDGRVLRVRDELLDVPLANRAGIAERMVDTLAALHTVDPESVGLADFGRPDGFMSRQVRRWAQQLGASRSRELVGIEALRDRLASDVPDAQRATVVHGDYRLDNLMIRPGSWDVAAVLDWEMATLGDPLSDLGLLIVYWGNGSSGQTSMGTVADRPSAVAGYPSGNDLTDRYAAATGLDLEHLPWYVAFGWFKLAAILEGIHYRFTRGQTVGTGFDRIGAAVPGLVRAGHDALDERP